MGEHEYDTSNPEPVTEPSEVKVTVMVPSAPLVTVSGGSAVPLTLSSWLVPFSTLTLSQQGSVLSLVTAILV